jgi:hypothetical protein
MNKIKLSCISLATVFTCLAGKTHAQSTYIPMGNPAYSELERLELLQGRLDNNLFTDIKPYDRKNAADFIKGYDLKIGLSKVDQYWIDYMKADNEPFFDDSDIVKSKRPILKYFYRSKANLFEVNTPDFKLYINPVIGFSLGAENDSIHQTFYNSRGAEIRGSVDKVGFYSYITDNQAMFPAYVRQFQQEHQAIPGNGFYKPFKTHGASDYFTSRGYITYSPSEHIHFQFGNDKNFFGSGYRSLLLSDFSKDNLFLKISTRIWRFQYENIYSLFMYDTGPQIHLYPRHYGTFHYLSLDATKWLNVGLFEAIMFSPRPDKGRFGFDAAYLNPIIFYRSVEEEMGSPDNALVGANFDVIPLKRVKVYGQIMFDEFLLHHLLSMDNFWANKYSLQAGVKWVNIFGIKNFDWQGEYNLIRPYTYSSDTVSNTYSHYNQSLAHPFGANLTELISIFRFNPIGPLDITFKYMHIIQGKDTGMTDYGGNILLDYHLRYPQSLTTAYLFQGVKTTTNYAELTISYQIRHNLSFDVQLSDWVQSSATVKINTFYAGGGIRLNFALPKYQF